MTRLILIVFATVLFGIACVPAGSGTEPELDFDIAVATALSGTIEARGPLSAAVATRLAGPPTPTPSATATIASSPTPVSEPTPTVVLPTDTATPTPTAIATPDPTPTATLPPSPAATATAAPAPPPTPSIQDHVDRLMDSVVRIETDSEAGTGTVVESRPDGTVLILTNSHVIDFAESIEITTNADKTYTGTLISNDIARDLAVVGICCDKTLQSVEFATSVQIGSTVSVLGYPRGAQTVQVTQGIVSGLQADSFRDRAEIQIDATLKPGNSGGPVMLPNGKVAGLVTFAITRSNGIPTDRLGFAISHDTIERVLVDLVSGTEPPKPDPDLSSVTNNGVYENGRYGYRIELERGWWISASGTGENVVLWPYRNSVRLMINSTYLGPYDWTKWEQYQTSLTFNPSPEWEFFTLVGEHDWEWIYSYRDDGIDYFGMTRWFLVFFQGQDRLLSMTAQVPARLWNNADPDSEGSQVQKMLRAVNFD